MITTIIKQLQADDWYNVSEEVEIAKGRHKLPKKTKEFTKQLKRVYNGKKIYR